MKKVTLMLASLALLIGLASCDGKGKNEPKGDLTVTVDPTEVTLNVGEMKELKVSWEPASAKPKVSLKSNDEAVATIITNEQGKGYFVKAIAAGSTKIIVTVGDKTAECAVTVKKKDGPTPPPVVGDQMPLLKFTKMNLDKKKIDDQEIIDYEAKLNRVEGEVSLDGKYAYAGFVNKDLSLIPAVVYGLPYITEKGQELMKATKVITTCLVKESLSDHPETLKLLAKHGFEDFKEGKFSDTQATFYSAIGKNNPDVTAIIYEQIVPEFGTQIAIDFRFDASIGEITYWVHETVTDAKDFPAYDKVYGSDLAQNQKDIKAFEESLALRDDKTDADMGKNLYYSTKADPNRKFLPDVITKTNFAEVFYRLDNSAGGEQFVNTVLLNVKNMKEDCMSDAFKAWCRANNFEFFKEYPRAVAYKSKDGKYVAIAWVNAYVKGDNPNEYERIQMFQFGLGNAVNKGKVKGINGTDITLYPEVRSIFSQDLSELQISK